jgi:hypothetical protein
MSKLDDPTNPDPDGIPIVGGETPDLTTPDDAPTTELQEWRRRALEAESLAEQLAAELADARAQLDTLTQTHALDAILADSGAIDAETVRALINARTNTNGANDPGAVITDLKRAKPFLFAHDAPTRAPFARSAMTQAPAHHTPSFDDLDAALELAATSGDRAALLRYLRLRRGV